MSVCFAAAIVSVAVAPASTQRRTEVIVALGSQVQDARCVVRESAERVPQVGQSVRLTCPVLGIVQCDAAGFEPVDVAGDLLCRSGSISFSAAEDVRLQLAFPARVELEWIEIGADATQAIVARRDGLFTGSIEIPLADRPQRAIRISQEGASPVTVMATGLLPREPWTVPVLPGGELVVQMPKAVVQPEAFEAVGPTSRSVAATAGLNSVPGLPEGPYSVRAVYSIGRTGAGGQVEVAAGSSVSYGFSPEAIGALAVEANSFACSWARRIVVAGPSGEFKRDRGEKCDWLMTGFEPGTYAVMLEGDAGPIMTTSAEVGAQVVSPVRFEGTEVRLSGQVRLNGHLGSGFVVQLQDSAGLFLPTEVGAQGGVYTLVVGQPGVYVASVRDEHRRHVTAQQTVRLLAGANQLDWDLDAGLLSLNIGNWDRSSPVEVTLALRSPDASVARDEQLRIEPGDELPIRVIGLPFGDHRVSARQRTRLLASESTPFTVVPDEPEAEVTLDLSATGVTLVLQDGQGLPVNSPGIPGERIGDGVYQLMARPGTALVLRPEGYTPVCRMVPDGDVFNVVVHPAQARDMYVVGQPGQGVPALRILPPGSDCPIDIRLLNPSVLPDQGDGVLRLRFRAFQGAGDLTVFWSDRPTPSTVAIPPSGPILVRKPNGI